MLEKKSKIFCDSHFHVVNIPNFLSELQSFDSEYYGCSTALFIDQWEKQLNISLPSNIHLYSAFGLHPQSAGLINIDDNLSFLETLLSKEKELNIKNKVWAIGEAGFDFFTEEFKNHKDEQEKMFHGQMELALKYNKPLIIHCRKANEKLFENAKKLKKIPAVLFHSFMGSVTEAESLLKRGINGYFSFGKQMINNNKHVIECVKKLPLEKLLAETDAPYQTLKNQPYTKINDIKTIYEAICILQKQDETVIENKLLENFKALLNIS